MTGVYTDLKPYFETVFPPAAPFPARAFITTSMEHVIRVHPHWHPIIEILYYMNGSALQQVNDRFFTAVPGDIVIIGRDQLHSTYTVGTGNCRIMVLQFDADRMLGRDVEHATAAQFDREIVYRNPLRADGGGMELPACVEELYGELERMPPAYEYMARAAVFRLAGLLRRTAPYSVESGSAQEIQGMQTMLEKTFRLVDESFSEQITLEDAATASNLSTTHFCRLFKRSTGMTFHEYLTFYRVNRAGKLLGGGRKLAGVAFECGFGSVSSFIRNFRKYKNCAPSRYIRPE